MTGKGIYGVGELVKLFKKFDTNKDSRLDRHEVQWVLKQNGHDLSPSEFERLFKYFDANNDGAISIAELLYGIRGGLSESRQAIVADAWSRIAPKGLIAANDFAGAFNVASVPEYAAGRVSKADVLQELMNAVDLNDDGVISADEFKDFYTSLSPSFSDDTQFRKFVHNSWGLY